MAKKKFNNVVIKDEELTPTTIGVYSNKTKNPITLILLIIAFIAIAVYLPDIQSYVNKMLGNGDSDITESNNGNNGGNNVDPDDVEEIKEYPISTTSVDTKEYSLSNITLNDNTLSFTFTNKKDTAFDLKEYYLELSSSSGTFLGRVKVSNDSVGAGGTKDISLSIYPDASKFSFVQRTSDDYPAVTLNYNEEHEATMSCRKDNHVYTYLFVDDSLSRLTYIFNPTNNGNDSDYQLLLQEYYSKPNSLNLIEGVTSSFSSTINSFYFTMNVDVSKANISEINDDNLFKAKTEPKEVKFIEEARGFTCTAN